MHIRDSVKRVQVKILFLISCMCAAFLFSCSPCTSCALCTASWYFGI